MYFACEVYTYEKKYLKTLQIKQSCHFTGKTILQMTLKDHISLTF